MIVVADTGPLRYLIEVDAVEALPRLYGRVITTPEVMQELGASHFPDAVRRWSDQPPAWLQIQQPNQERFLDILHVGEASALSVAVERGADLILVDDRDARRIAATQGIECTGTLGVIREAGARGYIDFERTTDRLVSETKFWHTPELIEDHRGLYEQLRRELERQRGPERLS